LNNLLLKNKMRRSTPHKIINITQAFHYPLLPLNTDVSSSPHISAPETSPSDTTCAHTIAQPTTRYYHKKNNRKHIATGLNSIQLGKPNKLLAHYDTTTHNAPNRNINNHETASNTTSNHWSKSMLSGTYRVYIRYPICIRYV
jgi:hypothetical protein